MKTVLVFFIFISILPSAKAEYRVFQLLIYNKPAKQEPKDPKASASSSTTTSPTTSTAASTKSSPPKLPEGQVVLSTLDPLQYTTYFPVGPDKYVVYTDTWRCRGRTNGQDLCPNPKLQNREPANAAKVVPAPSISSSPSR